MGELGGFVFQKVALYSIQAICTHKQIRPCVFTGACPGFFRPGGASTLNIPFKLKRAVTNIAVKTNPPGPGLKHLFFKWVLLCK